MDVTLPTPRFIGRLAAPMVAVCLVLALATGCAHANLPGTQIRDTQITREIYQTLVEVKEALETRDADKLIAHVSRSYFEDNGTPDPKDDYGFLELRESLLADALGTAKDLSLSVQIYDIEVDGDRAWADLRYMSRARLEFPSGRLWDSHRDFDRIEFLREDGQWLIVRGL